MKNIPTLCYPAVLAMCVVVGVQAALLPLTSSILFVPDIPAPYSITFSDIHYDPVKLKTLTDDPFEVRRQRLPIRSSGYDLELVTGLPLVDRLHLGNQLYSWVVLGVVAAALLAIVILKCRTAGNRFK